MNTPPTTANAWVQAGFQAQQQGDAASAERAYRAALALQPEHPAALQLLGSLLRRQGDAVQAETLLRRSLAADGTQAHVWNNLGNLLLATQRAEEALACYEQALALQPTYADAHYNRARALHAQARLAEAADSLNAALAAAPQPTVAMLQLHAQIEGDAGNTDSALRTLDKALSAAPQHLGLLHNRAVLLQRLNRHEEALATHEQAEALGLDAADAHYNRGNTLQSLRRHEEALAAYRQALARDPHHNLAHYDLARLRWRLGDADFDAELRQAQAQLPAASTAGSTEAPSAAPAPTQAPRPQQPVHATQAALAGLHGHLLWRAERHAAAAEAYGRAVAALPQAAGLHDGLARCLVRVGELQQGLAAHARAVALAPHDAELHTNHAASLLVAGRPDAALAAAEAACTHAPAHQHAQALRVLAWRLLGDPRATWADDPQRLVRAFDLPAPEGFATMASFNAALAEELRRLHADRQAPIDQTLRGGTQTLGNLFDQQHPLVNALKARISEAVQRYVEGLPADATHPFLGRRPPGVDKAKAGAVGTGWRYTDSWSSRLRSQGFHTDHVHPHGWVSSAYYVSVPAACDDAKRREGWLRFGRPDLPLPGVALDSLVQREVQPQPGRLVLFPSMAWHGTRPFEDSAERLTIAFDVMPA
jgi:tetratricopeptide (TPR) repeat protein